MEYRLVCHANSAFGHERLVGGIPLEDIKYFQAVSTPIRAYAWKRQNICVSYNISRMIILGQEKSNECF